MRANTNPALSNAHSRAPFWLAAATLTLTAGCAGHHSGGGHGHKGPPGPEVFHELEPNDSPFAADFIGGIDSFSHLIIEGHVQAFGHDLYDHFEFFAEEPIGVEFRLDGYTPGADVDLCLIDGDTGQVLACYDSPFNSEDGFFTIDWSGKHFILLVETYVFDTEYDLEIVGLSHPAGEFGDGDGTLASPADAGEPGGTGISFPEGQPSPQKARHLPGGTRADDEDEALERRAFVRG